MGFAKILTLYMCVSIALYIGSASLGEPLEFSDTIAGVLGVSGTGENMTIGMSGELNQSINQTVLSKGDISVVGGGFWDRLNMVWGWVLLMFNLVFIPVEILVVIQAPWPIVVMMSVLPVLFIAYLFAFILGRTV